MRLDSAQPRHDTPQSSNRAFNRARDPQRVWILNLFSVLFFFEGYCWRKFKLLKTIFSCMKHTFSTSHRHGSSNDFFFFWRNFKWYFLDKFFLDQKCVPSSQKKQMKQVLENLYFSKDFVFKVVFCLENLRKDERHLKKNRKKKKRKTQQTQKIEGQMKNSEAFFLQKMEQQSRGDNRSFLIKKTIFLNEICSRKQFFERDFFRKEIF